mmetsp:Transcript_35866/g.110505  ORF Transcript_35866/g.110505 Transcript_35866/m.110505 type:complete len:262 (-) Transcript_35866:136-921(-)
MRSSTERSGGSTEERLKMAFDPNKSCIGICSAMLFRSCRRCTDVRPSEPRTRVALRRRRSFSSRRRRSRSSRTAGSSGWSFSTVVSARGRRGLPRSTASIGLASGSSVSSAMTSTGSSTDSPPASTSPRSPDACSAAASTRSMMRLNMPKSIRRSWRDGCGVASTLALADAGVSSAPAVAAAPNEKVSSATNRSTSMLSPHPSIAQISVAPSTVPSSSTSESNSCRRTGSAGSVLQTTRVSSSPPERSTAAPPPSFFFFRE